MEWTEVFVKKTLFVLEKLESIGTGLIRKKRFPVWLLRKEMD
jgi:hypothetical protein